MTFCRYSYVATNYGVHGHFLSSGTNSGTTFFATTKHEITAIGSYPLPQKFLIRFVKMLVHCSCGWLYPLATRPTQPPTLRWTGNKYHLQMGLSRYVAHFTIDYTCGWPAKPCHRSLPRAHLSASNMSCYISSTIRIYRIYFTRQT